MTNLTTKQKKAKERIKSILFMIRMFPRVFWFVLRYIWKNADDVDSLIKITIGIEREKKS